MSEVYCWECEKPFGKCQVFDIPVFKKGFTIKWCYKCARKQMYWMDNWIIENLVKSLKQHLTKEKETK